MRDDNFFQAQAAALDRYGVPAVSRWVDAPVVGGRANVLAAGDGPPVVLLNGIGVPAAMLAPIMSGLHGFTQYAIDLPGYGLTDAGTGFVDDLRPNAVRFLVEVFDGLGRERPVIVANSLGSLWASWLAIDHPDRATALAHVGCPAIVFDTSAPLPMRMLSVRGLRRLLMKVQPPSAGQVEQLSKMVHEHPLPPEIARLILATERLDHFEDAFLAMIHRLLRVGGNRPRMALTAEQLGRIDVPTLLLLARDDPVGGPDVGRRMAEVMSDAELHIVDGGHAPWLRHADQIAAPLHGFLHRVSRSPLV
ncbi:MAG: alpha/beta fold hydrolase [Acidimicrobiales bacterium]